MKKILYIFFLLSIFSSAEDGVFYIGGEVVKAISISLGVNSIDFGDVFTGTDVDAVPVDFYIDAEAGYEYQIEISNNDNSGILQVSQSYNGGYTGNTITYDDIGTGVEQTHEFYVDLDTSDMSSDLSATITVTTIYLNID